MALFRWPMLLVSFPKRLLRRPLSSLSGRKANGAAWMTILLPRSHQLRLDHPFSASMAFTHRYLSAPTPVAARGSRLLAARTPKSTAGRPTRPTLWAQGLPDGMRSLLVMEG
jgi:hypothetical protein